MGESRTERKISKEGYATTSPGSRTTLRSQQRLYAFTHLVQLKLSSFKEASATPPIIGRRQRLTRRGFVLPRIALITVLKKGSAALTMWVKGTLPAPMLMTVIVCPRAWKNATFPSLMKPMGCFLVGSNDKRQTTNNKRKRG